jgi:hypothetical protein
MVLSGVLYGVNQMKQACEVGVTILLITYFASLTFLTQERNSQRSYEFAESVYRRELYWWMCRVIRFGLKWRAGEALEKGQGA